jgi:hypothetical protein
MIAQKELVLREGFWHGGYEKGLPKPISLERAWTGKKEFLKALTKVESRARRNLYRGWSTCRVCEKKNGSAEFSIRMFSMKWMWPCGFAHYVKEHNVRPSLAFQTFITEAANTLREKEKK